MKNQQITKQQNKTTFAKTKKNKRNMKRNINKSEKVEENKNKDHKTKTHETQRHMETQNKEQPHKMHTHLNTQKYKETTCNQLYQKKNKTTKSNMQITQRNTKREQIKNERQAQTQI